MTTLYLPVQNFIAGKTSAHYEIGVSDLKDLSTSVVSQCSLFWSPILFFNVNSYFTNINEDRYQNTQFSNKWNRYFLAIVVQRVSKHSTAIEMKRLVNTCNFSIFKYVSGQVHQNQFPSYVHGLSASKQPYVHRTLKSFQG